MSMAAISMGQAVSKKSWRSCKIARWFWRGGWANPAYENLKQAGLKPITTDIKDIETAVQAYIDGTIIDNPRRRHSTNVDT